MSKELEKIKVEHIKEDLENIQANKIEKIKE
jgi:hypothetical protein